MLLSDSKLKNVDHIPISRKVLYDKHYFYERHFFNSEMLRKTVFAAFSE